MPKKNAKLPPITILQKFEFQKPTSDESWYPSFDDGTVRVSGSIQRHHDKHTDVVTFHAGVAVYGADDFGMSKWMQGSKSDCEAWYTIMQFTLTKMAIVTQAGLKDIGFERD